MKHHGRNRHRLRDNPTEKAFADEWEKANKYPKSILGYLVGDGNRPGNPTPEQVEMAATVVQWLGSPVGQIFLRDVGFVRKE